ncbi:Kinetochore protein NDC80 [Chionoecetes opilio]|uniref:Kinetochore protein NDC80 n=1 Tax=Chionoecetes opilio TaxID=41210 RepID=A0A8J4YD45_CHIOP|nr:Kinetochore protein NDC80 [Chionoecetes opilio]
MKRSSSGRGSIPLLGVLQPRGADFTPNNRQSAGFMARKSFIPKLGLAGSAKGARTRIRRSSNERMARPSLVAKRFTPTRLYTPSNHPQSANRLSTGSARGSGVGGSTRKDPRFINDPAYKTQNINKILDFLRVNTYRNVVNRRTLLTPSTKDFTEIFTVIGSPHTWPAVLASLGFLVDIINLDRVSQDPSAMPSDLDGDDGLGRDLECCIALSKCDGDEEISACLEVYLENIKAEEGVSDKEMMTLEKEVKEAEDELESVPDLVDELEHLRLINVQYSDDLVKLKNYLLDLKDATERNIGAKNNAMKVIDELKKEEMKILEENDYLKGLQRQQGYNDSDLIHLKYQSQETAAEIEHQDELGKEIRSQIWEKEKEMGKAQSILRSSVVQFESRLEKMGIRPDFHDLDINSEELNLHYEVVMNRLTDYKKRAKKAVTQTQSALWEKDEDAKREQSRLEELELLHQRIIEARKRRKKPLRQLQDMMESLRLELESSKKKEAACVSDGHNFLTKLQDEMIRSNERKRKMFTEHTSCVVAELDALLEWLYSQDETPEH